MAIDLFITVAKALPVVGDERWRHGRIAEVRVTSRVGRCSSSNITLGGIETLVVALLGGLRECRRRRWRRIVRGRLRMGASGNGKRKQQCSQRKKFLHEGSSLHKSLPT
jgi:hypothetical protein